MTAEEYKALLNADFDSVDLKQMPDVRNIRIDSEKSLLARQKQYLRQVGNPYLVRVGNMKIKVRFSNNGVSFHQAFENMLLNV